MTGCNWFWLQPVAVAVVENFLIWQLVAVAVGPNMAQQLDPTGPHISTFLWERRSAMVFVCPGICVNE
jgi:hypothetical protein